MSAGTERLEIIRLAAGDDWRAQLTRDVQEGLTAPRKSLPPKYLYDAQGSELFEKITGLPEYYQTRTETALLEEFGGAIIDAVGPRALVELGSGASRKTRLLLEAMHAAGSGDRYVPLDVSPAALEAAAEELVADYPWLHVTGVVGDFHAHLADTPHPTPALVAFLGSTVGNLHPSEQPGFFRALRAGLGPEDALLVSFDLVKEVDVLEAAYNDASGVTAEFNLNVLRVLNRELAADFPLDAFEHVARYDAENAWIEIVLRATSDLRVHVADLDLDVTFIAGEELRTEISCKYTRDRVSDLLAASGLRLDRWMTDSDEWFALAIARP